MILLCTFKGISVTDIRYASNSFIRRLLRYQDEYDSEQTERPQTNENDENVKIADINGENEQIEYLEVEEPLAYEESGDNVVETHNDPDDDESAVME